MISSITRKLKFAKFYTGASYHRDSTKFQSDTSYHRDSTKFQSGASYQLNSSKLYSETSFSRGLPHFAAVSYAESAGKAQSGEKPTLFYTDTLRGFRAQGCASDRHKAPRSSLEEARWGDWRLLGAQARSRKRSTRGRVKTGSACPGACAEPYATLVLIFHGSQFPPVCAEPHAALVPIFPGSLFPRSARSPMQRLCQSSPEACFPSLRGAPHNVCRNPTRRRTPSCAQRLPLHG